jgi:hypothetical protein
MQVGAAYWNVTGSLEAPHQLARWHAEAASQPNDRRHTYVAEPALRAAHLDWMHSAPFR